MAGELTRISGSPTSTEVVAYLQDPSGFELVVYEEDPEEVSRRILLRQLTAQSADELFGSNETLSAQEVIGVPLQVRSVEWRPSQLEGEGLPFFAVCKVARSSGEIETLTCGAQSVCLKLAIADSRGWLPLWLRIVMAEEPTRSGRRPLDLVTAAEPTDGEAF